MRIRSILGALVITALPFTSVWAENMTPEDIKKLVDEAVTKQLQEHEQRLADWKVKLAHVVAALEALNG